MRKYLIGASAALLAIGGAGMASAATIVYTVNGTASGTLDGTAFSGGFTLTSFADTTTQNPCIDQGVVVDGCFAVTNDRIELDVAGMGIFNLTNPSISFVNNSANLFGFSEILGPSPVTVNSFAFVNITGAPSPFSTWDGVSDLAPFASNLLLNTIFAPSVQTDGGELVFDAGAPTPATFSAAIMSSAVPEPATWAFMIFGFGAVGGALRSNRRRQRKAKITVSYL